MRKLLLHALAYNKKYEQMIPHLKILMEQNRINAAEREDLKRIQNRLPPKTYPKPKKKPDL